MNSKTSFNRESFKLALNCTKVALTSILVEIVFQILALLKKKKKKRKEVKFFVPAGTFK